MEEEIEMMKDKEMKAQLKVKLQDYINRMDPKDGWPYYSEEKLEEVLKNDIFSAGVLILECVQNFPSNKKKNRLFEEDLEDVLEICGENYSDFFNFIIRKMLDFNPITRWTLEQIQEYLSDIYSYERHQPKSQIPFEIEEEPE